MKLLLRCLCLVVCFIVVGACQEVIEPEATPGCDVSDELRATALWKGSFGKGSGWACLRADWRDGAAGVALVRVDADGNIYGKREGESGYNAPQLVLPASQGRAGQWLRFRLLVLGQEWQEGSTEERRRGLCERMGEGDFVCDRQAAGVCWFVWTFVPGTSPNASQCSLQPPLVAPRESTPDAPDSSREVSSEPEPLSEPKPDEPGPEPPPLDVGDAGVPDLTLEPTQDAGPLDRVPEIPLPERSPDTPPGPPCKPASGVACYPGPPGQARRGVCKMGTRSCFNGKWTPCVGHGAPQRELCGSDNNCNGYVTERGSSCKRLCPPGSNVPCVVTEVGPWDLSYGPIDRPWMREPAGVAYDPVSGNIYVADAFRNRILVYEPGRGASEQVSVLAGAGAPGFLNGPANTALFHGPRGLALRDGKLYVADTNNHCIRTIDLGTLQVETVAGACGKSGSRSRSKPLDVEFNQPWALAFGQSGRLFVTDPANLRICRIDFLNQHVQPFGASGGPTGPRWVSGIAVVGPSEDLYVTMRDSHTVHKIVFKGGNITGMTTIAGMIGKAGFADSSGLSARFRSPAGIVYLAGLLYVVDVGNKAIRIVDPVSKSVRTLLGMGPRKHLLGPLAIAGHKNYLYIGDRGAAALHRIALNAKAPDLTIGVAASGKRSGAADQPVFHSPHDVVFFSPNPSRLFVVSRPPGGLPGRLIGYEMGRRLVSAIAPPAMGLSKPLKLSALTVFSGGGSHIYASFSNNHKLYSYALPRGPFTHVVGSGIAGHRLGSALQARINQPSGLAFDGDLLYFADSANHRIKLFNKKNNIVSDFAGHLQGLVNGAGAAARFDTPTALALDKAKNQLFVADTGNNVIRVVDLKTKIVKTLQILGNITLDKPEGLLFANNKLYVADTGNHCIRVISFVQVGPAQSAVLAGVCDKLRPGFVEGAASTARFSSPRGMTIDAKGDLYIADTDNHRIRKVILTAP